MGNRCSIAERRVRSLALRAPRHFGAALVIGAGLAIGIAAAPVTATEEAGAKSAGATPSLDEQVQEIKSDVLEIAAELANLEERLLYPSDTQLNVFLSIAGERAVGLDSARVTIDGELVTHHLYSFKELGALERGGVQRLYTGNLATGEHVLEVLIAGHREGGDAFELSERHVFTKQTGPGLLGITLKGEAIGSASIDVEEW